MYTNNLFESYNKELNKVSLTESTKIINEEEKSMYNVTEEDLDKMNLNELTKIFIELCDEGEFDNDTIMSILNDYNCLNLNNFKRMVEEQIEYFHFGD